MKKGIIGLALTIVGTIFFGFTSAGPPIVPRESPTSLIPPWFAFNIGCKLHEIFNYLAFVTQPPDAYVIQLSSAYWNSEVAYALTKNNILDCVQKETSDGGTVSCAAVADKLDFDSFIVCRYMESGMHLHLLNKDPATKEYSISTHGALLTNTGDLKDFMLMINEDPIDAWRAVTTDLMKDGGKPNRNSGMEIAYGMDTFTYFVEHPEQEAQFDRAMKSLNPAPTGAMLMDWVPPSEDAVFCDIGGGIGALTGEVLNHYPKMSGINFDRPEVIDRAQAHLELVGVADRTQTVAGSFFENLPEKLADCDIFNLRYILHAFDDESSVKILQKIREVSEKSPKDRKRVILIQDQIIETGAHSFFEHAKSLMSINMIANSPYGSRERTIQEHADLFAAAGYKNSPTLIPLRSINSMVEIAI